MAFWLRAGLVIGAIYYLSPLRLGEGLGLDVARVPDRAQGLQRAGTHAPSGPGEIAGSVLAALPDEVRARAVEAAAAETGRALGAGLRAAVEARAPSRDTLTAQDRQPAWRGAPEREAR